MNGIDKITSRIHADAEQEIETILAEAKAKADEISKKYEKQAEKETADLLARSERSAEERGKRLESVAQLEGRKMLLAAKQEVLGKAFDKALEQLNALPEDDYVDLLATLCARAADTGREEVIFSKKDRQRVGKRVVSKANSILAREVAPVLPASITGNAAGLVLDKMVAGASALLSGTGMLTLAEETREITGGFILAADGVEVNCAFETLVRLYRSELERQVAQVLFEP